MFSCLTLGAQEKVLQGRVVDAETGEALPYAQVYVDGGRGAMTNAEGEFCVKVSERGTIRFSYVGYEKLETEASTVPQVIALKPFSQTLREVVVDSFDKDSILSRIIEKLRNDYSQNKSERHGYFMRTLLHDGDDSYLIESLLTACPAVNLRELLTLSGRSGMNAEGDVSSMGLGYTNIQHMAEVGPRTSHAPYWQNAVGPLNSMRTVRKFYDVELQRQNGSEGERLYLITFRLSGRHAKALGQRRYLTGTAYVDAGSLRMLRFDGEVNNASQWVNFSRQPARIEFRMTFDHTSGYTSVQNLAVWGGGEEMRYHALLYRVEDISPASSPEGHSDRNLLKSVDEAGYDSALWERYDIVKRTEEEERAASRDRRDSLPAKSDSPGRQKREVWLASPGTLRQHLTEEDIDSCQTLVIHGHINSADIRLIRSMSHCTLDSRPRGRLQVLDLRDASIVGDKDAYLTIDVRNERMEINAFSGYKYSGTEYDTGAGLNIGAQNQKKDADYYWERMNRASSIKMSIFLNETGEPHDYSDFELFSLPQSHWVDIYSQKEWTHFRQTKGYRQPGYAFSEKEDGRHVFQAYLQKNTVSDAMFYRCQSLRTVILSKKMKCNTTIKVWNSSLRFILFRKKSTIHGHAMYMPSTTL
ncbi:MAG: carboxypeptidase-like regulatory domain-containing protein [Bacteroidaceae bacterium]|nr:carboxypeptidase-like regulatory domain-containing protein [Bacteroidaceae bacterium]